MSSYIIQLYLYSISAFIILHYPFLFCIVNGCDDFMFCLRTVYGRRHLMRNEWIFISNLVSVTYHNRAKACPKTNIKSPAALTLTHNKKTV